MSITAILVTYNSAEVITGALESIHHIPNITHCIIVDNASSDRTLLAARVVSPDVQIIENMKNEGFGRANNQGVAHAVTEFVLLMNPDGRITAETIQALLAAAARYPDAAILAPQLADAEGKMLHSYKRSVFYRERKTGIYYQPEGDCCAEFLSGAVWLVRREVFQALGGFDPHIFLYYEDDDFCLRVRAAGYACVLVADARAIHWVGRSTLPSAASEYFRHKHMMTSRLYIEQKYRGKLAATYVAIKAVVANGIKYLVHYTSPRRGRYAGRLKAIKQFLKG